MASEPRITDYLAAGLRAAGLRSKVIANNIANMQTPGFRRQAVDFENVLAEALGQTNAVDLAELEAEITRPMSGPVGGNGNDVVLEKEVAEMVKNSAMYKTYVRVMAKMYQQMELAIRSE